MRFYDNLMEEASHILLQLLRNAIGTFYGHCELSSTSTEVWKETVDLALDQGVEAIAFDGYKKFFSSFQDGDAGINLEGLGDLRYVWLGYSLQAELRYRQYESVIESLSKILKVSGRQMMMLKGYGLSQNYPIPAHRPLGDIDIYQGINGDEVFRQAGINVTSKYHKHSSFVFQNIIVENHLKFLDDFKHKSNRRFEVILESLNDSSDYSKDELMIGEQRIQMPSSTFNALFLLRHAGEHFAAHEMTIRQVLDIGLFYREHHSSINWQYVFKVLKDEGMWQFYNAVGTICVDYLGISSWAFRGMESSRLLAEKMWNDILQIKGEGTLPSRRSFVRYSLFMTRRWWRNRWKYKMVYNESLWESFWLLAWNRVKGDKE